MTEQKPEDVSLTIQNALKRLPDLYLEDPAVREILRIKPDEEAWLTECWGPGLRDNNPIFGRLDAMIDFISPMWKDSLRFVEPNLGGIGGLHLVPTSERMVAELTVPLLREQDPELEVPPVDAPFPAPQLVVVEEPRQPSVVRPGHGEGHELRRVDAGERYLAQRLELVLLR